MVRVSSAAKKYMKGVTTTLGVKTPSFRRVYKKRRVLPARLRVSKSRYQLNRAIAKQINNMTENKFQGYTGDCLLPVAKPAGAQPISYHLFNTGGPITSIPGFVPMNLFNFPIGDGSTERNGNYMYIKKTHLKMEIQMLPTSVAAPLQTLNSTTEFRLMIVKANRKFNKLGSSPVPANSLFLNTQNDQFGLNDTGSTTFINMQQPINKRKWLVYKDMRFTLSPPSKEAVDSAPEQWAFNAANPKYPVKKFISCDLPVYKKCHFETDQDVPDNVDTQWLIIIQAVRTNYCTTSVAAPRDYRLNMCATTSASDN
ncbi:MAG: putative capsid protein [Cressdnaviricota sp.]|nr:MAG: putative capsid protein [Cressdnaviricota sp.]